MSIAVWGAWGDEWGLNEKVSFNGYNKHITVNSDVTVLDIAADVYSAWCRWMLREDNSRFSQAIRYSGYDPIPSGFTGAVFFMTNGWKLCYNPVTTATNGVLYSESLPTAYWSLDGANPIYPAIVSSLVNSSVSYQNVVTGTALTAAETGNAVRAELTPELLAILTNLDAKVSKVLTTNKFLGLK